MIKWDIAEDRSAGWLRIGARGPGVSFTTHRPYFSERVGIRKPFLVLGKRRFFILRSIAS